nr:DC-STAMP domain-containing protein 2 isoform X1 [Crassostrea gigas]
MKSLFKGVFMLLISGSHAAFYMMCDYGLYWLLEMLRRFFTKNIGAPVPPHLKVHVHGKGAVASMYRALMTSFDPMADKGGSKLDAAKCIPIPSVPNIAVYEEIGTIFLICFLMTIFKAYGLRLRHIIAACYYPRRERARAVWLYNHILKTRGGFLKFARRQMRRQAGTLREVQKISIRSRMMSQYPLCRKFFTFLGFKRKYCLSCGEEGRFDDHVNYFHCQNSDCTAVYCMDCFTDINNICTVCMNPVDYGDLSDISEERDSSEDEAEMLKRKEEAEKIRKEREEQRLKNRPSQRMRQVQLQFNITQSIIDAQAKKTRTLYSAAYDNGYQPDDEFYEDFNQNSTWVENKDWKEGKNGIKSSEKKPEGLLSALCPCFQACAPTESMAGSEAETEEEIDYSYQELPRTDDEYDESDYYDDDKSQTDYVTNDIFDDEEDDFIGDYDYAYIEPDELEMDRDIVLKTNV